MTIRPIAIYLPQFHPIPENDRWWGKGFTEWRKVVQAKSKYNGHYQPHYPSDLGFYDLRLEEIRIKQEEMARKYGIAGFCYYHYWSNGRRILEMPVDKMLNSDKSHFPFMLCWANENWTRTWDGGTNEVLLEQHYSEEDHLAHIKHLMKYFKDSRYIKVDGKPVFVIYKDAAIPNVQKMISIFENYSKKNGLPGIYFIRFSRRIGTLSEKPIDLGFSAEAEFQPLSKSFGSYKKMVDKRVKSRLNKILGKLALKILPSPLINYLKENSSLYDMLYNYREFVEFDIRQHSEFGNSTDITYPGVCPSWDNSARRRYGGATIFSDSCPNHFEHWLRLKVENFKKPSEEENFVFINAWNEWAEGNHLEPCLEFDFGYLEAVKRVTEMLGRPGG